MHVYSVDEVFLDVTDYLKAYEMTARQLTQKIIQDIYDTTGDYGYSRNRKQSLSV